MRVAKVDAVKNITTTINLQGASSYGALTGEAIWKVGCELRRGEFNNPENLRA
jgi:hypothetical protein